MKGEGMIKKEVLSEDILFELADFFKNFGDTTRIKILCAISEGELCVGDIAEKINVSQTALSHQLKLLKSAKLVKARKDGKNIFYSLDDDHVKKIIEVGLDHINE